MRLVNIFPFILIVSILTTVMASGQSDSLFVIKSTSKDVAIVTGELKRGIVARGMKIFSEVAHHAEAQNADEPLRFTLVITFGNPKVGTKLMQLDQRIGYALPLKILIIKNESGQTQILFRDPKSYLDEYNIKEATGIVKKMSDIMNELVNQVL